MSFTNIQDTFPLPLQVIISEYWFDTPTFCAVIDATSERDNTDFVTTLFHSFLRSRNSYAHFADTLTKNEWTRVATHLRIDYLLDNPNDSFSPDICKQWRIQRFMSAVINQFFVGMINRQSTTQSVVPQCSNYVRQPDTRGTPHCRPLAIRSVIPPFPNSVEQPGAIFSQFILIRAKLFSGVFANLPGFDGVETRAFRHGQSELACTLLDERNTQFLQTKQIQRSLPDAALRRKALTDLFENAMAARNYLIVKALLKRAEWDVTWYHGGNLQDLPFCLCRIVPTAYRAYEAHTKVPSRTTSAPIKVPSTTTSTKVSSKTSPAQKQKLSLLVQKEQLAMRAQKQALTILEQKRKLAILQEEPRLYHMLCMIFNSAIWQKIRIHPSSGFHSGLDGLGYTDVVQESSRLAELIRYGHRSSN